MHANDKPFNDADAKLLERTIDCYGIETTLMLIADICIEKSCHIAEHWQDTGLAKRWAKLSGVIATMAIKGEGL